MKSRDCLIFSLLTTGLLIGTADSARAQLTGTNVDEFQQIEQSPALNIAVTTAGIGIIGLELWWFVFSKPKAKAAVPLPVDSPSAAPPPQKSTSLLADLPQMSRNLSLRPIYNGIEMAHGVLTVEARLQPRFSGYP